MGRYRTTSTEGILRTRNLTLAEAAKQLGVSTKTVERRRREMGIGRHTSLQQQRKPGTGWS